MPRGGYRVGAGSKPTWNCGKTKTIRVPELLADRVLEISRLLDEGQSLGSETTSKVVDLSGVVILHTTNGPVVRLVDLLRAGYEIRPERLVRSLKLKAQEDLKRKGDLESLIEEFYE